MATSSPITIAHPYAEVFRTLVAALPQHKIEIVGTDEAQGVIHAKTGINLRTWGETITIQLGSHDGGATTEMIIDSKLKFGLAGWGKHESNFATITQAVQTALGGPASQPSPQQQQAPPSPTTPQPPPPGDAAQPPPPPS